MPNSLDLLTVPRLNGMMQGLQDVRTVPGDLLFSSALPLTPATDGEITALDIDHVLIADLVAPGAAANVYQTGKLALLTNNLPKIKVGRAITEEQLEQIAVVSGRAVPDLPNGVQGADAEFAADFLRRRVKNCLLGIRERLEVLAVAMHLGTYTYNRFGYQIPGATWGMPADLQIRVGTNWSDATNGDGGNDIIGARLYAQVRYGVNYNRMTCSLQAFRALINQAKFQSLARMYLAPNVSYANLPLAQIDQRNPLGFSQVSLAKSVLGLDEIRLYSKRFWVQDPDTKAIKQEPFLPIGKVILDKTENDNNADIQDVANGVTTESMVSGLMARSGIPSADGMIGQFDMATRGPIAYAVTKHDLNPAGIAIFASMKAWPRRRQQAASAVLDVGPLTDAVPTTEPILV